MIEIDGGYLEGGGQILRTAVALSSVTGRACRVTNIRSGRPNPGLRPQHLSGIEACARICGARLVGAAVDSQAIEFIPGRLQPPSSLSVRVGTAGSAVLVVQALLLPLLKARQTTVVEITGGTHVKWAPLPEYFEHVFRFFLGRMGADIDLRISAYGFYPRGGGKVVLTVGPSELRAFPCTQAGGLAHCQAWSGASTDLQKARVAERQIEGAEGRLTLKEKHISYVRAASTGSFIFIAASSGNYRLGCSVLGERGKRAVAVGRQCAELIKRQIDADAPLDEHMADQILPYMALCAEDSQVKAARLTDHCRTNIWVIEKFLPVQFQADERSKLIACRRL